MSKRYTEPDIQEFAQLITIVPRIKDRQNMVCQIPEGQWHFIWKERQQYHDKEYPGDVGKRIELMNDAGKRGWQLASEVSYQDILELGMCTIIISTFVRRRTDY